LDRWGLILINARRRVIQFPSHYPMGRLYIPGKNGDAFFSLAVGKISVPADLPLILRVRQDADNISPLKRLEVRALYGLSIANTELTDEHLSDASSLDLRLLQLFATKVTGKGLRWLHCSNVTYFDARRTLFSDDGVSMMKSMAAVASVNLSATRITDKGVNHLADLAHIRTLLLWENAITSKAAESLCLMKSLEELAVGCSRFSDDGLSLVSALPRLSRLTLHRTMVSDIGLRAVAELTNLTDLDISGCEITDRGLEHMAGHKRLRALILADTLITDRAVPILARFPRLQELDLRGTAVTGEAASALGELPTLKRIVLSRSSISPNAASRLESIRTATIVLAPDRPSEVPSCLAGSPIDLDHDKSRYDLVSNASYPQEVRIG
jgi:Leucine-rich repeat (LRR) protein